MLEINTQSREFVTSLVLVVGFFIIQIMANLTVAKATPIGGGLAIPIGSLLYAVSFTWIDLINDYMGKHRARLLVSASIVTNVLMVAWFELYIWLPGTEAWHQDPFKQSAISFVFGGVGRVFVASLLGAFVVDNTDITIFHFVRRRWPNLPRWARSAASNTVSGPLDAVLFSLLAFSGSMPASDLRQVVIGGALYKLCIGYLSIPLIYLVKARTSVIEQPQKANLS